MKKFISAMLCFVFIFLCSCNGNQNTDTTASTQNTSATNVTRQNTTESSDKSTEEIPTVKIPTNPDDPYSIFIKKRYEDIYEAQKIEGAEYFAEFDKHSLDCFYFIYDIDGNGVDELILGDWKAITNDIEDYFAPKKIVISSVYTLENGELVKQETHPWWNDEVLWDRVILSNGLIRTSIGIEDSHSHSYLEFKNGSLKLKYAIYYKGDGYGNRYYEIIYPDNNNNYIQEKITKEEFERLHDEANGDAEVVEINWKRIDEYGR